MISIDEQAEFDSLAAVVRAGGFTSLDSKAKRDRYRELKDKIEQDKSLMTMTKADLEKMVNDAVNKYKEASEGLDEQTPKYGEWKKKQDTKAANPVAKIRVFREDALSEPGIVTDLKYKKMAFNEDTRRYDIPLYLITVLFETGQREYELPLTEFMKLNEFETVEIVKQDVEELVMSTGTGERSFSDKGYFYSSPSFFGTKQQASTERFEMEVTKPEVMCTVKRPNGSLLVINNNRLNA